MNCILIPCGLSPGSTQLHNNAFRGAATIQEQFSKLQRRLIEQTTIVQLGTCFNKLFINVFLSLRTE